MIKRKRKLKIGEIKRYRERGKTIVVKRIV